MPSTTIDKVITPQQAADALQEQLGNSYKVTQRGSDSLTVHHGPMAFATVRLHQDGNATTFHAHGSGLIINRIVNEFGIARRVTAVIKDSLGAPHPA